MDYRESIDVIEDSRRHASRCACLPLGRSATTGQQDSIVEDILVSTGTFDTLTAARKLESAKFSREQAEAIAQAIHNGQGELATKTDLAALKSELKSDISWLRWCVGIVAVISLATLAGVIAVLTYLAGSPAP